MDPGSVSQGVQGCPSPGMAERGEGNSGCNRGDGFHLAPEMVVVTVVTDCRQCLERLVSKVVDLGWMDKRLKQVTCPSSSHNNNKQMCHRTYRDLRARQTWMQVVKGRSVCRDVNKETCPRNARTGTSMVWCAMDSPTTNVYATEFASVCTKFWLCEYAWWTKVWKIFQT